MHASLVSLLLLAGAGPHPEATIQYEPSARQSPVQNVKAGGCGGTPCGTCGLQSCGQRLKNHFQRSYLGRKFGPMPQSCYAPRYGCYPGNQRYTHRYPAFHGYYYRRPYNYRHVFDYPWHAELHEPTSMWSYNVPSEGDFDEDRPPLLPTPEAHRRMPRRSRR